MEESQQKFVAESRHFWRNLRRTSQKISQAISLEIPLGMLAGVPEKILPGFPAGILQGSPSEVHPGIAAMILLQIFLQGFF